MSIAFHGDCLLRAYVGTDAATFARHQIDAEVMNCVKATMLNAEPALVTHILVQDGDPSPVKELLFLW